MEATTASDKGRLSRQAVASPETSTEGNPSRVSAETPGKPGGFTAGSNESNKRKTAENPPENRESPETRLGIQLRTALEDRGALVEYDKDEWDKAIRSLVDRGYSHKEIEAAIRFTQQESFWAARVSNAKDLARDSYVGPIFEQTRRWFNRTVPPTGSDSQSHAGPYPPPRDRTRQDWFDIYRSLLESPEQAQIAGKDLSDGYSDAEIRELADECLEQHR